MELAFHKGFDEQEVKDAIDRKAGDRSLDLLATSRQAFAVNPSLAWDAVSTFRKAWGFIDLSFLDSHPAANVAQRPAQAPRRPFPLPTGPCSVRLGERRPSWGR